MKIILLCLISLMFSVPALADAEASESTPAAPTNRKVERAIVPLINFTTDRGFGYGAYGALFYMGSDGPDPYALQVGAQFYRTTGGYQDHKLVLDVPSLAGGRLRADLHLGWERWDQAYYFGQGNRLPRLRPEDTPKNLYAFGLNSVRVVSKARYQIVGNWHGFAGQLVRTATIDVYPNSRLDQDRPAGIGGGVLSQIFGGVMVDTRDHEFAPTAGSWSEISVRTAQSWLGSTWSMWGVNLTDRGYWSLGTPRLVLAHREGIDLQRGDTPFFHQIVMGGSQWVDIGGPLAMRGLPIGRYRGEVTLYGDVELRWQASDFTLGRANFRMFMVPFVSAARVIESGETDPRLHPHGGAGLGVRLLYNEVFQARFDVAAGREEYQSVGGGIERDWVPAFYLAFNTPY